MTDDELESRIESLFGGVVAPDGVRRWENEPVQLPRARGGRAALARLPAFRRLFGRWAPLALAAAISIVVGVVGLVASGGVHLRGGGSSDAGDAAAVSGTAGLPPARLDPTIAYDPAMHAVVMFGGRDKDGKALADTWAWDGTSWKQLHPATSPPARSGAGMAWDSTDGRLVLAGGIGSIDLQPSTTWTCSTSTGTQSGGISSAVVCRGSGFAYAQGCAAPANAAAAKAPLPTCSPGPVPPKPIAIPPPPTVFDDTWTWDGSDWHAEHPAHNALPAVDVQMVTDPSGGVVMTGQKYAATPTIACAVPPVAPNVTPPSAPACAKQIYPTPATQAARWQGRDWVPLASIPASNVRLALAGNEVVALSSSFGYCYPPLEAPAGAAAANATHDVASGASIACPLVGDASTGWSSSTSTVTATATATATRGSLPTVVPVPPQKPWPTGPQYAYVLKGAVWQRQTVDSGPSYLISVSSFKGWILAIDVSGRSWTGDGRTWRDSGKAPVAFVGYNARLVEDTDWHVAVLIGGYPTTSSIPVWEWDGSKWQLRSGTLPPPPPSPEGGVPSILPAPASPPPPPKP